jgi:hypothetical protein
MNKTNKILTLIGALAIAGTLTADANINDSYAQSCKRYGKPAGTQLIIKNSELLEVVWYPKDNWTYVASFNGRNNRCDAIRYVSFGTVPSDAQIDNIIGFNIVRGDNFTEQTVDGGRFWRNDAGTVFVWTQLIQASNSDRKGYEIDVETQPYHVWRAKLYEANKAADGNNGVDGKNGNDGEPQISDLKPI